MSDREDLDLTFLSAYTGFSIPKTGRGESTTSFNQALSSIRCILDFDCTFLKTPTAALVINVTQTLVGLVSSRGETIGIFCNQAGLFSMLLNYSPPMAVRELKSVGDISVQPFKYSALKSKSSEPGTIRTGI